MKGIKSKGLNHPPIQIVEASQNLSSSSYDCVVLQFSCDVCGISTPKSQPYSCLYLPICEAGKALGSLQEVIRAWAAPSEVEPHFCEAPHPKVRSPPRQQTSSLQFPPEVLLLGLIRYAHVESAKVADAEVDNAKVETIWNRFPHEVSVYRSCTPQGSKSDLGPKILAYPPASFSQINMKHCQMTFAVCIGLTHMLLAFVSRPQQNLMFM